MVLVPELHRIPVCPESKQALLYVAEELVLFCPNSELKYRVDAGIPVMLVMFVEEAERVDDVGADRLMAHGGRR